MGLRQGEMKDDDKEGGREAMTGTRRRGADTPEHLAEVVNRYKIKEVDGFWWCGGTTAADRDYRCVLLARVPGAPVKSAAAEFCAQTAKALTAAIRKHGYTPPSARRVAILCESAGRRGP